MYIPRKASATVLAGVAIVAVLLAGAPLAAGTEAPAPMPTSSNVKDALINQNPDPNGPSIAPPNQDLWTKTMNQSMEEIINNFPNIVGQGVWDEKSGTSTQNYYTGADPAQEASFLAAARQIDALVPSSLKLVWKPVDWSDKERSSLVQQISADPEKWTSYFGSAPQGGNVGIDGNVHVSLTDPAKVSSSPAKSGLLPDGTPFIAEGPTENEWQVGRTTDVSPFTGGNLITAGSSYCT